MAERNAFESRKLATSDNQVNKITKPTDFRTKMKVPVKAEEIREIKYANS